MELFNKKRDIANDLLLLVKEFVDKIEHYDPETVDLINKNLKKITKTYDEEPGKSFEKQIINAFITYKAL
jgi:hypothetical protein